MPEPILEVKHVTKRFGGVLADNDISLEINRGEIVGLVGPNGCGKTTLFNCITGYFPPTEGKIFFQGENITGKKPYEICKRGIARTFQLIRALPELTVFENVMIGAFCHFSDVRLAQKKAMEALELVGFQSLIEKRDQKAGDLTTVEQKVLEIVRAVATNPTLLMLDEAMAGLNSSEINESIQIIRKLRDTGVSIVIIEHIMQFIMQISDRVIVMEAGSKLTEGLPEEIVHNEDVINAYLGVSYSAKRKKT